MKNRHRVQVKILYSDRHRVQLKILFSESDARVHYGRPRTLLRGRACVVLSPTPSAHRGLIGAPVSTVARIVHR
jgi:hypothetical protein